MATSLPDSSRTPQLNGLIHDDTAKGVAVHTFDPDASPEAKAAAAGKAKDQLKPVASAQKQGGKELAIDTGGGRPPPPPTITVEDADASPPPQTPKIATSIRSDGVPGEMIEGAAPEIPDWYKVGWREVSGIDRPPLTEGEEKDRSILETWVKEQYYGEWYHNAAVIFFAVAASHFLTVFRFGWGWLFLVLIACSSYYSISIERVRRRSRDDIQRELVKSRLVNENETADWINNFLDRFWLIYEPVLSATVVSSVDQILSTNTPAFLDSIRLSTFTLGNKAPRINHVRTYPNTAEDVVTMDWALSFTPCDTSDLTPAQAKARVNPKIVLSIRVGKGFAGGTIPILLEDIEFSGEMTIRMKLMTNFPHVKLLDLSFVKPPVVDYVLKPIGGETLGFDIAHIPGLSSFIRDTMHSILGPMMYAPNMFTLNLEQMLSGAPLDAAIGVLQITIVSARSLKGVKIGGGTPDPYVAISISGRAVVAETIWKPSTYNPSWNETKFLLINSLTETLNLAVRDHNDHRADGELGAATFDLGQLAEDATRPDQESKILKDGKERGDLRYDISFYPVLKPKKLADGKEEPVPDTKVGIVRLTIHQAKDLDHTKSMSGDLNPFARVLLGSAKSSIHDTPRFKHTNNPVWESATEFLCPDKGQSYVSIQVIDDRSFLQDPIVGYKTVKLIDLMDAKAEGRDWLPLDGCKSGRIRLSAEWKALDMAGSLQGADQYVPPIGIVRLWIQKATDVKNVEAALGGKSDPYVRVLINGVTEGRTEVVNNNLNPEWDQILYIPVHSLRETMLLECMDYQHLTKDRSIGNTELKVADLAKPSGNPKYPFESTGKKTAVDPLRLDRGNTYKGNLHYMAEFVPCLKLKGVSFDAQPTELSKVTEGSSRDSSSVTSKSTADEPQSQQLKTPINVDAPVDPVKVHVDGDKEQKEMADEEFEGVEMLPEELLKHQSGIVVINIVGGTLSKKARVEVLLDDGYWPACSTARANSTTAQWNYVGEGFIKELDFSRVWLRLNENGDGDKDDIVGEVKMEALKFLREALDGPVSFTLEGIGERRDSVVQIAARYVPVEIKLEPRESINNQGVLRVELVEATNIHAADRGGKSDPYVVFTMNGEKIYKSQTKKKTLNPEWNETFTCQVPSRVAGNFSLEVFDWNQIEQAKSLGSASIAIEDLEPFQGTERNIPLSHDKHGDQGHIKLLLTFQPEIIAKSRKNTSTFSTAGRAMTQIGHMPFEGAKGVAHGVGSAGSKVTGIFKKDHAKNAPSVESISEVPLAGQVSQPVAAGATPSTFPSQNLSLATNQVTAESGSLKVTVISAKDLAFHGGDIKEVKPYVTLKVGDKEHKTKHQSKSLAPEWNETFSFPVGPETPNLVVEIFDHKTFGKDRLVADGTIEIWKHVQPVGTTTADVFAELRDGQGLLKLRLDFERGTNHMGRGASLGSLGDLNRNGSPVSPSRFMSMRKKKEED